MYMPANPAPTITASKARTCSTVEPRSVMFPTKSVYCCCIVVPRSARTSAQCVLRDASLRGAPQDDEDLYMASKSYVILRRPQSGRLEGRKALQTARYEARSARAISS